MSHSASAAARRLLTLVLLGLLALLLWGQCALLFPGAKQPATVAGWVKSTDSLRTAPATLYLTLGLRNDLSRPVRVREVSGTIRYYGRTCPFSATAALRDTLLAPWTQLTQAVAVPLHLPADSVALLRTVLQPGARPASTGPLLRWRIQYSEKQYPNARDQGNTNSYLPLLKSPPR